ncbi:semaphorin-7A [Pelodytes ibericus]
MTPLRNNPDFPPGQTTGDLLGTSDNDTPLLKSYVASGTIRPLSDLLPGVQITPTTALQYLQLKGFLSKLPQKHNLTRPETPYEELLGSERIPSHGISLTYQMLMEPGDAPLPVFVSKWEQELQIILTRPQWPKIFALTHKTSLSTKTQEMNYKLLTRWYRTPEKLHAMFPEGPDVCAQNFSFPKSQPYAVFHLFSPDSLYVGGRDVLYHFNFKNMSKQEVQVKSDNENCKMVCENQVTLIGQLEGKLLVCGTNAEKPGCWNLDNQMLKKCTELSEEFSPQTKGTNYNILITGNETYSTVVKLRNNGNTVKPKFHKIYGNNSLYTGEYFMTKPYFVKSLVVKMKEHDKVLLFFMEDNDQTHTTEKRVSMIAQICKGDLGSEDPNRYGMFSTALKSRLICGDLDRWQYFPYLQDIFLLKGKDGDMMYGLFTNAWNRSAVCSYSLPDIERVFSSSTLLGSERPNLSVRPGTCLNYKTPADTFKEAASHPELTDWVKPLGSNTVFQTLNHYTKLVVDEVTARNKTYKVIFLASDDGYIHKVVELENGTMNVLEMRTLQQPEQILYLELEPAQRALYVGTTREVAKITVDDCSVYGHTCESCIMAQDPYCGWIDGACESILKKR